MLDSNDSRGGPSWLRWTVVGLLLLVALATRGPAPWRLEVINDEMYHLESWIRHYRSDDIAPLFHRQVANTSILSPGQKATVESLYRSSPLVQRLICLKNDYGSFGFSASAEAIEALSHSNLVALRLPSLAFAFGTLVVAYLLGVALKDRTLGLWLATLFALGPLPQAYAGLARPHGWTQFALVLVLYRYVLEQKRAYPTPRRLLLAALFAQTTHLTCWASVGLIVLGELIRRYRAGSTLKTLIRQTWWYAAVSVLFLGFVAFNGLGTSFVSANTKPPTLAKLWVNVCVGSPFGHLGTFGPAGLQASGLAFAALAFAGVATLLWLDPDYRGVRWTFLAVALVSVTVPLRASNDVRHLMIYGVSLILLASLGARRIFSAPTASIAAQAALLASLGGVAVFAPVDPYRTTVNSEARYSEIARSVASVVKPGDAWLSWPYFTCLPLYPYLDRDFPAPILPLNERELAEALKMADPARPLYVLTGLSYAQTDPALKGAEQLQLYANNFVLLRLPPAGSPTPADAVH